ncbi:TNR [Branchiostoma lanceolatum]|uniref:TNR protein n=1 Tax=Branchiostoma lanceolatum TaxID=7740 RepID=A0A8J9ZFK3_BRALA|nr:TNR [Branchiostoma lanceolatum]
MASPFPCLVTFLVTFVFLCSSQSVFKPPSDEKCVCNCGNTVVNFGNENALKSELEQMKIAIGQLSQKIADWPDHEANANGTEVDKPQDSQDILDNDDPTPTSANANDTEVDERKGCACQNIVVNNHTTPSGVYKPQDCQDILDNDETTPSGVYMVYPRDNLGGFLVYCDMDTDGGGWTLFQRRQDGTVDFYRDWADYKTGFPSNLNGEFWLGNDNLYRLAVQKVYRLRVDMEDVEGNTAYAAYDTFAISPESQNYTLHIGTYSGTAGNSLAYHDGQPFSTKDRDNDEHPTSCAQWFKGAWWYSNCHNSNLNGLYHLGPHESAADGVNWYYWKMNYYSLKCTEMKIRPAP